MYELIQVSGSSYYVQSPAKIGLVRLNDTDVCLIDSGSDKDAGRKARQLMEKNGWHLTAIYNTHSHADHIGGNRYLQSQTGCRLYAPGAECAVTRHTVLEPSMLYGGCPPKELRHKFLMAQESDAAYLTADVLPEGFQLLPLPGHCMDMVGFRTPDDVVYLADCVSSRETLEKYRIGYIYDVGAYLATLETVKAMTAKAFVPAHAEVTEDIAPLAQYNMDTVQEVGDAITALCAAPQTFEELLKALFDRYGMVMTFEQYALVGATVRSYLTWLKETGRVTAEFADNRMLWRRV
jgi:glyoxylase-like metal-dependent hydrolase (beta-lactamase superfamily II)